MSDLPTDDWVPPPGMLKRLCLGCARHFPSKRKTSICPDCLMGKRKPQPVRQTPAAAPHSSPVGGVALSPATNPAERA